MPQKLLLKNFNLEIEAGSINAIVGPSGFGKSTVFNLLYNIYKPDQGSVTIDDQKVSDMKFDGVRQYLSIIPQNGLLFNETVMYNLRYNNPDVSDEEIVRICKICQIHDTIENLGGYEIKVGDGGGKLSGGERQRILIARGLLKKNAKIFMFDEATSNLDPEIE